jgi:hypothetical protein
MIVDWPKAIVTRTRNSAVGQSKAAQMATCRTITTNNIIVGKQHSNVNMAFGQTKIMGFRFLGCAASQRP